jgi:SAM-dependent methyltransferase
MSVEAFEKLITPKPGRTLIVGSRVYGDKEDRRKRYPDAVGVDMQAGEGVDIVADMEDERVKFELRKFDHIECMSMLEHCRRPWEVAENIEALLKQRGTLFVTVPFIWRVHGYPDDYWRMTISGVKSLFQSIQWKYEAYSGRGLTDEDGITSARSTDDWPCFARTEVCMFGHKV